jgi:hypothetical protein
MPYLSLFALALAATQPKAETMTLADLATTPTGAMLCQQPLCWQVTPQVCLVDRQQQLCQLELSLSWQSQQQQSLCVYLDQQQLSCWLTQQQGHYKTTVGLAGPAILQLRDLNQQVLLSQHLTVLSRQPERRRRLVAPWSVF